MDTLDSHLCKHRDSALSGNKTSLCGTSQGMCLLGLVITPLDVLYAPSLRWSTVTAFGGIFPILNPTCLHYISFLKLFSKMEAVSKRRCGCSWAQRRARCTLLCGALAFSFLWLRWEAAVPLLPLRSVVSAHAAVSQGAQAGIQEHPQEKAWKQINPCLSLLAWHQVVFISVQNKNVGTSRTAY